jgi:tRNA nucleotidyltransferase (CCA-adding enzyme)
MKVYCVGGALRDELLGLAVQDRDWVVVGASPEDLISQGFTPVGKDFPVFLHPKTHEEYALARTERKTGPGYRGFQVQFDASVTLEDDLLRRDLTINAMARAEGGALIDPFHGQQDLEARVFRHVSPAFAEDPVRVLRVARFAARFTDFKVAPETFQLMREMARAGELSSLVPERVWQELARGLMEQQPSRMFDLLQEAEALKVLFEPLDKAWQDQPQGLGEGLGPPLAYLLDRAAKLGASLEQRYALLSHTLGDYALRLSQQWRVPSECRDMAQIVARDVVQLQGSQHLSAEGLVQLLERVDAKRKPQRFEDLLASCQMISPFDASHLKKAQAALSQLDEGSIAKAQANPSDIKLAVHRSRVEAVLVAIRAV